MATGRTDSGGVGVLSDSLSSHVDRSQKSRGSFTWEMLWPLYRGGMDPAPSLVCVSKADAATCVPREYEQS